MGFRRTSIAVMVIFALVTVATLVLGTSGVINYQMTQSLELDEVRQALALDADQIAPSLDLPVWNFDHPEIDKVVESMMLDPILQSVKLTAANSQSVLCARERDDRGNIRAMPPGTADGGVLRETRKITFAGEILATVTLVGTTKSVDAKMQNILVWTIGNILGLDLILVVGLYLLLHRWVLRPLQAVEAYAAAVCNGGATGPVKPFRGELESLRSSIQRMLGLLNSRYQALHESEEKFAKAFQSNPSGIAITELETGRYLAVNESFGRIYGFSPHAMEGRTSLEVGVWSRAEERSRLLQPLQTTGTVRDLEMITHCHDGSIKTVLVNAELIELGGRRCIVSLIQDITERKRTEAALIQSEERFSRIFRSNPMPIALTRLRDGLVLDVNEGFLRFSGYARDEVVGRTAFELNLYQHLSQRTFVLDQLRQHGHLHGYEQIIRTKFGQLRDQLLWFDLLTFSGEQCLLTISLDVTERKQAEERERQAKDDFTRKLIASQEAERSRLAGELHDSLGQNLILIKNRAQLGLDLASAAPELRDQFQNLLDMATGAIAEVRQISRNLRPYQLDQLGLGRALEAMIDSMSESSRLPISRQLDPVDDLFAPEAATHLYRVAQESISNLLKHSQARSAHVGLERDMHDVRLWIQDDGRGFATPSGAAGVPGRGLGLSSMAERVRILGGTLRIESAPGRGTRVDVVIPHAGNP